MHIFSDLLFPILRKGRSVLRRGKEWFEKQTATVSEAPIIVLGNQKSGTSAIAHLLADYGGLSKTIDIPPLWGYEGLRIMQGRRRFSSVVEQNPYYFSTEVIKEPMMTFFVGQVVEEFAEAQYVFIVRDPRDNIRSLLNSRDLPGDRESLSKSETKHLDSGRVLLNPGAWGISSDNYIELLAKRWVLAVQGIDKLRELGKSPSIVRYEDFMEGKIECIRKISASLSVEKKNSISGKVDVSYQPRGNRNVYWGEFYGEYNLSKINKVCHLEMEQIGYCSSHRRPIFL
jgi:hypothetical protein